MCYSLSLSLFLSLFLSLSFDLPSLYLSLSLSLSLLSTCPFFQVWTMCWRDSELSAHVSMPRSHKLWIFRSPPSKTHLFNSTAFSSHPLSVSSSVLCVLCVCVCSEEPCGSLSMMTRGQAPPSSSLLCCPCISRAPRFGASVFGALETVTRRKMVRACVPLLVCVLWRVLLLLLLSHSLTNNTAPFFVAHT